MGEQEGALEGAGVVIDEHGARIVDRDEHGRSLLAAELVQDLQLLLGCGSPGQGQAATAVA